MFRHYLRISLRNIRKNKGFALINISGLSLGLACIMVLALLVHQYYTTDSFHENADRIYYLKTFSPNGLNYSQTTFPLLYEIQKACPEVEAATHWQEWDAPWLKYREAEVQDNTIYADTGFLNIFSFPLKEGNPRIALSEKHNVVISQKIASQLFGQEKALGKTITASDSVNLTVSGVLAEIPENSSLKAEIILPVKLLIDNPDFSSGADWYNTFAENYLLLKEGADPKLLDKKIDKIVKQNYFEDQRKNVVKTVPLTDLKTEGEAVTGSLITGAVASAVFLAMVMLANLLNLNTAMVFSRTKEVAVRRVIGSGRKSIVLQFCVENALIVLFSLLLAFVLFNRILLPLVSDLTADSYGRLLFRLQQDYLLIFLFIVLGVVFSVLAGSVPAWYLTSVKISEGVKGKFIRADEKGWLRGTFITLQFTLAVVLIAVAIISNSQIRFMKSASPGYNAKDVVVVNLDLAFTDKEQAESRFETILQNLQTNPHVKSFSTNQVIPTGYWSNYNTYIDLESGKEVHLRHQPSDAGFAVTFQIPVLAGRNFDDKLSATENGKVILNQTAVEAFGWSNPIGRQIKGKGGNEVRTVVGVLNDFHYDPLQKPIEPLLHGYIGKQGLGYNRYLSIRIDPEHQEEIISGLEQEFNSISSRRPFSYTFMEELADGQYAQMNGLLKVTNFIALLSISISAMGLFGLVALFARQRVKEIGIRKVLGAGVTDLTALLSKDFVKLIFLSILIATPIAWYAMNSWLEDFAYRITLSWWFFAGAGFLALLVALLTVGFQAIKAATANPVKALRTE